MPIPKPETDETEKDFIVRCMSDSAMKSEYKNDQRLAICTAQWKKKDERAVSMKPQTRFIDFEASEFSVESKGDTKILRGYAAKFDSISGMIFERNSGIREVIRRGFFRNALVLDSEPLYALFNHDENIILGERKAGTLAISEDSRGLAFEAAYPDTGLIRDMVIAPIMRGELRGCSFRAFWDVDAVEYDTKRDAFVLQPGGCDQIVDVGPVTFAAYGETEVTARNALERMRKHPENRFDDEKLKILKAKYGR